METGLVQGWVSRDCYVYARKITNIVIPGSLYEYKKGARKGTFNGPHNDTGTCSSTNSTDGF